LFAFLAAGFAKYLPFQYGTATLSISYYDLGYTTGEMAVKILKGESNVSDMPIEYTDVTKKYNKTICDDLGLTVPEGYEAIEG
jgi:putative tryptophan/tyrosine transport system substrate-binding protein